MAITVNLRYIGHNGNARKFAEEMTAGGKVAAIRAEAGNLRYEYYQPLDDPETILLIDSWENQEAIDIHHASPMMATTLRSPPTFIPSAAEMEFEACPAMKASYSLSAGLVNGLSPLNCRFV